MSSGVEAEIALDAAVVLSLGMNRVLGTAAGLAAGGAGTLAALAEGRAEAREAALRTAEDYERAVRAVLDINARIAALDASQHRAGEAHDLPAEVALPAPLTLSGQPAEDLATWCAATDDALNDAEQKISANIAAAVAGRIFDLPAAALHSALPEARQGVIAEPATGRKELAQTLARVLSRVLPDAAEADHRHIAEAAERLVAARTAGEAEGHLTEVRLRVQAANLHAEAVRAEDERLAQERQAAEQAEAERRYVVDTITTAFGDLGYEVDTGFETMTARDGTIVLTKGDWPGHAVKMRIDPDEATLRAAMVRDGAPQSEEERRVDAEREREWCDAFETARARLAAAGVHSDVRWRIEPGERQLPSAPEAHRPRARPRQRERQRERPQ
ncbi:response regulator receiver protein [Actinomadura sp. HBU206391]|uniref:response regulator receiver protein n=1 Tax=Actinomadura sp. HBU206391 TaxID=2731692 RepID=UPI001650A5A1|nr:response regulator receiver protein [Actinomadura sp. HBU206391]MBC6457496.1 response regulator receiver protein [Actinomadura sp. HBU206391]